MNAPVRVVADAIIQYLAEHPDGADTAEGIHQWWLRPGVANHTPETTVHALELLAMEDVVESRRIGSRVLWRRRRTAE
jgi:hypothetical protein